MPCMAFSAPLTYRGHPYFHGGGRDIVHHRALVTCWIKGDVELLRACGSDEADDKNGG